MFRDNIKKFDEKESSIKKM